MVPFVGVWWLLLTNIGEDKFPCFIYWRGLVCLSPAAIMCLAGPQGCIHCSTVSSTKCKPNFCWFTRKINRTHLIGLIISSQTCFILPRIHTYRLNPFAIQTFSSTLKVCIDQWGPLVITESEALYENVSSHCGKIKWNRCYANAGSPSVTVIDGGLSLRERAQPLQFKMLKSRLRISSIWAK